MGLLDGLGNAASQVGGVFKGAGEVLWETGAGVVTLGGNALKAGYDLSPAGWAVDALAGGYERVTGHALDAPDWLPSAARGGERMEAAAEVASTLARNPGLLVDAVVEPITADWQAGNYGEAIGRGAAELVLAVVGTKGADKAAKGARAADAADAAVDAVRAADRVDTPGHAGRTATRGADDTRLSDVVADADTGRVVAGRPVLAFESMDDFNLAANAARPDTVYEFGNYRWTTDDQARVIRAEGRVDLEPVGRNDSGLQREIGNEGRPTDVGFHVIADRLGGPTNRLNVVPGNGKPIGDGLPNLNNGDYKRFENQLARLADAGHDVDMRVSPQYNPGNTSSRPDAFVAEYRVDGGDWIDQTFPNK
ncbi:DNA/RNA non-specific endonuclease [Luteimonas deserti]|uniref:DNA/RNA non-specific endonuclease n=1 Tax=Luteimonas deserti TaxID=2752306 RepID=A0A7Z0QPR9_9GAMM|nr:DNA/RNA non-specific endonuclease [Luteimonas deserti]NYZ61726.1 DNA/RNA non-specific endonuclease [Luteimonas deserti]